MKPVKQKVDLESRLKLTALTNRFNFAVHHVLCVIGIKGTDCDMNPSLTLNLLALELFFLILAHLVYKMLIIQEPNTLEL